MKSIEQDIEAVTNMLEGDVVYIAWFEESGGAVHKIWDEYFLFEITLHGCATNYVGHFSKSEIGEVVKVAHSWT